MLYNTLLKTLVAFAILIYVSSCSVSPSQITGSYNYTNPTETIILPDTLWEISGITIIDSNLVARQS